MFKVLGMLKRKPGISRQEFVDYYESTHSKIGENYLRGLAVKYLRKYLDTVPHPLTGEVPEAYYDVVLEMWFENRAGWDATVEILSQPDAAKMLDDDARRFVDTTRRALFTVDERVSDLGRE
jgi:hypothetical protein